MSTTLENWAIHAYADDELEAHERAEVERLLEGDVEARKMLESIRLEKQALKRGFDSVLDEPIPYALLVAAKGSGPVRRRLPSWAAMAAAVAMLAVGGAGGWLAAGQMVVSDEIALSRRALMAHEVYAVDVRHPVEVAANDSEHLKAWLTKRVGVPVKIPDLQDKGLTFIGGRLLAAEDRPAGQLMYEDANKQRVALYVVQNKDERETSLHMLQDKGLWACYWMDGKVGFVITGEMSREQMTALADEVYRQLEEG